MSKVIKNIVVSILLICGLFFTITNLFAIENQFAYIATCEYKPDPVEYKFKNSLTGSEVSFWSHDCQKKPYGIFWKPNN